MSRPFPAITLVALLAACQPVPIGQSDTTEKPRPIKPLPAETMTATVVEPEPPGGGFKVAKVGEKPAVKPTAPAVKPPAGQASISKLSAAELQEKFQEAEDKAMSAANLQQSAQSKDDWNLVFERWKKAIALITPIASQSPQFKQRLAEYQHSLSVASQDAQDNLNPKAKPVQESGGKPMIVRIGEDPAAKPPAGKDPTPPNPADKPGNPAPSNLAPGNPAPSNPANPAPPNVP
jgi:hypothetical protein